MRDERRFDTAVRTLAGVVVAALVVTTWAAADTAHAAPRRADLVTSGTSTAATVVAGERLRVGASVRNSGRRSTGRQTSVRFLLSRDKRAGGNDRLLGTASVRKLAPRGKVTVRRTLPVAAKVPLGQYYVLACADSSRRVRESRESNNCGASRSRVRVTAPRDPGAMFPQTPKPLNVTYSTQEAGAVTRSVYPFGTATLTTTGDDGTLYELSIPPMAVRGNVEVTMTPIESIQGYPYRSLVGAVELQPHGLALREAATLRITPPAGTDLSGRVGFKFGGHGEDFHRFPVTPSGALTMSLLEFSTPGVGTATDAQLRTVDARVPAATLAQAQAALAESFTPATQQAVLDAYRNDVIRRGLKNGLSNDRDARKVIHDVLSTDRNAKLFGLENPITQSDWDGLKAVMLAWVERLHRQCERDHLLKAIQWVISAARDLEFFGMKAEADAAFERAIRCARFEVGLVSTATRTESWPDNASHEYAHELDASWKLRATDFDLGLSGNALAGSGRLVYDEFEYDRQREWTSPGSSTCPRRVERTVADGTVAGDAHAVVFLDVNSYVSGEAFVYDQMPSRLTIQFGRTESPDGSMVPGVRPSEWYQTTITAGCSGTPGRANLEGWNQTMSSAHNAGGSGPEVNGGGVVYDFGPFHQDGALMMRHEWDDRTGNLCLVPDASCIQTANTRVWLTHTPGG